MSEAQGMSESTGLSRIPFTTEAESQIQSLSFWLTVVGWLNIAAVVINVINLALPTRNFGHLINGLIHLLVGTWALQAARAFQGVATTDVADQAYLVQGFTKLRAIFLLQGAIILVGMAFVAAVLLFFVFTPRLG
ncbi:MAG TPA: hypothetical protein VFF52_09940 [Isosphaeraceae bacterium]|nr:hypothetical protein [Isosphaeraceae bacterium]